MDSCERVFAALENKSVDRPPVFPQIGEDLINNLKGNGNFIVSSEFNGMGDAKVENVKAMTEAVRKFCNY